MDLPCLHTWAMAAGTSAAVTAGGGGGSHSSCVLRLIETLRKRTVSAEGVHDDGRHDGGGLDVAGPGRGGRMSRQRKRDAVLRLLRGEDLEMVSRELGVTAATRATDGEVLESERLKARLGEMLLERELLEAKIETLEGGRPLARRRSRRSEPSSPPVRFTARATAKSGQGSVWMASAPRYGACWA